MHSSSKVKVEAVQPPDESEGSGERPIHRKIKFALLMRRREQKDLLGPLGLKSKSGVTELLSGKRKLNVEHLEAISEFLDVPIGWLVDDSLDEAMPQRVGPDWLLPGEVQLIELVRASRIGVAAVMKLVVDAASLDDAEDEATPPPAKPKGRK